MFNVEKNFFSNRQLKLLLKLLIFLRVLRMVHLQDPLETFAGVQFKHELHVESPGFEVGFSHLP